MKNTILFLRLEYHWVCINNLKFRARRLLDFGEALSSPKMLRLSKDISRHSVKISRISEHLKAPYKNAA